MQQMMEVNPDADSDDEDSEDETQSSKPVTENGDKDTKKEKWACLK